MKKSRSIAQIYLNQTSFTVFDILLFISIVVFVVLSFLNMWFFLPLVASIVFFLLSRSAHISDKEYEKLLSHLLAFNSVREVRSEEYERLLDFYIQGYVATKTIGEYYIGTFDLGRGRVRCGDDKELRSGFYHLSHLRFSDDRCDVYTCEVDIVEGLVTAQKYALRLSCDYAIKEKIISLPTGQKTVRYLSFPDCPPIPVHTNNTELEEILAHFKQEKDTD